jgi:hypothetical protein
VGCKPKFDSNDSVFSKWEWKQLNMFFNESFGLWFYITFELFPWYSFMMVVLVSGVIAYDALMLFFFFLPAVVCNSDYLCWFLEHCCSIIIKTFENKNGF